MKSYINKVSIDKENKIIDIKGEFTEINNDNTLKLCLVERKKTNGNKLYKSKKIFFDIKIDKLKFKTIINVSELLEVLSTADFWDIYIYSKMDNKYYICLNKDGIIDKNEIEIKKFAKILRAYITINNSVSFKIACKFNSIYCSKNDDGNICLDENEIFKYKNDINLRFKKRINNSLVAYDQFIEFPLESNIININEDIFFKNSIKEGQVFDIVLVLFNGREYESEISLKTKEQFKKINIDNDGIESIFYSTKGSTLAYYCKINQFIEVENLKIEDLKYVCLELNSRSNIQLINLEIINYREPMYFKSGKVIKLQKINYIKNKIYVYFDLSQLSQKVMKRKEIVINAKLKVNDKIVETILRYNDKFNKLILENDKIQFRKGSANELVLNINGAKNIRKTRIAVLGSCYSRLPFTSSEYYNPSYKERYEVVYTQFHSSIISLSCDYKRKFEEEYFEEYNPIIQNYIKTDFEKTFFENLKESNPDYLIIDLYADSQRGIILFNDGSIVTGNLNVQNSKFIDNLNEDVKFLSVDEIDEYLVIWKKYAEIFVNKLKKIIPENRIIINCINATDSYKDIHGEKKLYSKQLGFIRKANIVVDYMSEYLIELIPECGIINSRDLNYIGYEKHPHGNSPNHFESQYYKEFLRLLDKCIIESNIL